MTVLGELRLPDAQGVDLVIKLPSALAEVVPRALEPVDPLFCLLNVPLNRLEFLPGGLNRIGELLNAFLRRLLLLGEGGDGLLRLLGEQLEPLLIPLKADLVLI